MLSIRMVSVDNMTKKRLVALIAPFLAGALVICAVISLTGGRFVGLLPGVDYGDELKAGSIPANASGTELLDAASDILELIKGSDYHSLSKIVHPESGVLFSPYATISPQTARIFSASEVKDFAGDKQTYVWGTLDGSGVPIEMSPSEYFAHFVFNLDYTRAELIGIDNIVRSGNSLENISEVYPNMRFVDFHMPPVSTVDQNWSSLRLGFTEYSGYLMLSLILHSENTI